MKDLSKIQTKLAFALLSSLLCMPASTLHHLQAQSVQTEGTATVSGTLTDSSSAILRRATVTLKNERSGKILQSRTDAAGVFRFHLLPAGSYTLTIDQDGFGHYEKAVEVEDGRTLSLDVQLKVGKNSPETMVVSASGQEQLLQDAPASVSVIGQEQIEKQPVYNLGDLLIQAPGVTGDLGNSSSLSKITMRGMDSQYTLILVDGKRVNSSSSSVYGGLGYQDLNWISPEMIDHIEVIRGPMSTLYGSDAMGGMINIITKKIPSHWRFSGNGNYTRSGDSNRGDATTDSILASGPMGKKLGVRANYSFTQRNPDEVVLSKNDTSGQSGERNQTVDVTGNYVLTPHQSLDAEFSYGRQESIAPKTLSSGAAQSAYGPSDMRRLVWNVGHMGDWGKIGKSAVHLYQTSYNNRTTGSTEKNSDLILDATLDTLIEKGWLGSHFIRSGGQYHYMTLTNTLTVGTVPVLPDGTKVTGSALDGYSGAMFAEDTIGLRDNLLFTYGGRWDHDYKYGESFEPRVYVVYHPWRNWTTRGGVARGFHAPTLTESASGAATHSSGNGCTALTAYGYSGRAGCYTIGNPALKPETTISYEVGGGYSHHGYQLDATFFLTNFKNKIQAEPLGYYSGYWYMIEENISKARTKGLEFTTSAPITHYVMLRSNWTWMIQAQDLTTGDMLITTPWLSGYSSLDVNPTRKTNVQYAVRYTGSQLMTSAGSVNGFSSGYGATADSIVNGYSITDLTASYRAFKAARIRGGVNNLYQTTVDSTTGFAYYQPRRAFFIGLVANF